MRIPSVFLFAASAVQGPLAPDPSARICAEDYITVETVRGMIREIRPAPEPFPTADILIEGPPPCARLWMQVLKDDAVRCRAGGGMEVRGIIMIDPQSESFAVGPARDAYLKLGEDFRCDERPDQMPDPDRG